MAKGGITVMFARWQQQFTFACSGWRFDPQISFSLADYFLIVSRLAFFVNFFMLALWKHVGSREPCCLFN